MNLSIVVLTWNDWKSTIDCLQSIINNNYNNYDVILVDNNSNSKHLNFIKKWQNKEISCNSKFVIPNNQRFKKIIEIKENQIIKQTDRGKKNIFLIKNKENYGLTKGLNIGYKFSIKNKYKYVLRVDNDIFLEKNCINSFKIIYKKNKTLYLYKNTYKYSYLETILVINKLVTDIIFRFVLVSYSDR